MSLEELLSQIRARRLILTHRAALWAPNTGIWQGILARPGVGCTASQFIL